MELCITRGKQICGSWIEDVQYPGLQRRFRDRAAKSKRARCLGKRRDEHFLTGRQWKRAEIQSRDHPQGPQRADEELVKVIAGNIFDHAATTFRNDAFSRDELDPQQKIPRGTVPVTKRRIRSRANDSSDRSAFRKWRSKRQELTLFAECPIEFGISHAWLDAEGKIARLESEHAVHLRKVESEIVRVRRHADM